MKGWKGPKGKMDFDLCAAIGEIGHRDEDCIRGTARRLRVSRRQVETWMDDGPGSIPEPLLFKLAILGRMPTLYNRVWRISNSGISRRAA